MISLDKIKVIFTDFDDTVCIHIYDRLSMDHEAYLHAMYTGDVNFYLNKERYAVQPDVAAFLSLCHLAGKDVICLTWNQSSAPLKPKKAFLEKELGNIVDDLFVAGTRDAKLKVVIDYCKVHGIELDEVLLIDDHPSTLHEFRTAGIEAISPVVLTVDLAKVFDMSKL